MAQVRAVVTQTLHEIVEPLVYAEAQALIAEHRAEGDEIVVLSASGLEVVEPIAAMVGADRCLATRMGIETAATPARSSTTATAKPRPRPRATSPRSAATTCRGCRAYSDSITDLPLLSAVGHPTAVNPDRALRRVAQERGWPVLTFAHPVALKTRFRRRARVARLPRRRSWAWWPERSVRVWRSAIGVTALDRRRR